MAKRTNKQALEILPTGENTTLASYLCQQVKAQIPPEKNLAKTIGDLLHLSPSAVYKKMAGTVSLTADEVFELSRTFNISLDEFVLGKNKGVRCDFWPLHTPIRSVVDYFQRVTGTFQQAASVFPDLQLFYATTEATSFQYVHYPEVAAFKALMWSRATLDLDEIEHYEFRVEELAHQPHLRQHQQQLLEVYQRVPSHEFLSTNFLDNLLNHILFFASQRVFADGATPILLCEQLEKMLHHQSDMAKWGFKFRPGEQPDPAAGAPFHLFHNEMSHVNTHIMLHSPQGQMVFSSYDHPQFLSSNNPELCAYMVRWFERLRRRSNRISTEGEVQRIRFFGMQLAKVNQVKNQLRATKRPNWEEYSI
jgi:hypothetical protein